MPDTYDWINKFIGDNIALLVYISDGIDYTDSMDKDARSWKPDALDEARDRAILLKCNGVRITEIARQIGVSRQVVYKWLKIDSEEYSGNRTFDRRGKIRKLTPQQCEEIRQLISTHSPDDIGLPYLLWNIRAVQVLIQQRFNIGLAHPSIKKLLIGFGMIPKIRYDSKWYDYTLGDLNGMSLSEYARTTNRQLYLLETRYGFIYAVSKRGHIEFLKLKLPTRRVYLHISFLFRLMRKTRRYLLIAYYSNSFKSFCYRDQSHNPPSLKYLDDVLIETGRSKKVALVKVPYKYITPLF